MLRSLREGFGLLEFLVMKPRRDFCTVKIGISALLILAFCLAVPLGAQSPAQHEFLAAMCTGVEALSYATTPLSREHLADACGLMFSERLSEVCVAMASGASRPALQSSMTAQLAVGATSGADAGAGLIFALFDSAGGGSASSQGSRGSGRASCPQHTE